MTSKTTYGRAALLILVASASIISLSARAQIISPPADVDQPEAAAAPEPDSTDDGDPELDWSQLNVDASTLMPDGESKARRPGARADDIAWSAKERKDGAAAVSVKQSLSPFWNARIGADMTVTQEPGTMSELLSAKAANGGSEPQSSGTAWAAVTAPGVGSIWDKTAIEARVDPAQEQSKLGTSLTKSLPLADRYSLTLQNGYNLIQQGIVPVPGIIAHPTRNYETEQSARLSIGDTGTSLVAGQTLSSSDDKWLRKIGAEQKLFDGISVGASIGETAQGTTNTSVSAGFKRSW